MNPLFWLVEVFFPSVLIFFLFLYNNLLFLSISVVSKLLTLSGQTKPKNVKRKNSDLLLNISGLTRTMFSGTLWSLLGKECVQV